MANQTTTRIVEEGWRNAVVEIAGVLDSNDVSLVRAVKTSDFTNNDSRAGNLVGFRIDDVLYSLGSVLDVTLYWNSNTPQLIVPLSKSGKLNFHHDGGLIPDSTISGYDGAINLKSTGFPAGTIQNFTVLIGMVKLYK